VAAGIQRQHLPDRGFDPAKLQSVEEVGHVAGNYELRGGGPATGMSGWL
jgi:hypothetical protein